MKSNTHILNDDKFIKRFGLQGFFDDLPNKIRKQATCFGVLPEDRAVDVAIAQLAMWREDVDFLNNQAKQCAEHIVGKTVIINCDESMSKAALRWKYDLNTIAKNLAWLNVTSDVTIKELSGWTGHPIEKPYAIFDVISDFDSALTKEAFDFADKKLSGQQPKAVKVYATGNSILEQQLYIFIFGKCVAGYLAALNGRSLNCKK